MPLVLLKHLVEELGVNRRHVTKTLHVLNITAQRALSNTNGGIQICQALSAEDAKRVRTYYAERQKASAGSQVATANGE